jgi:hypothetical protein
MGDERKQLPLEPGPNELSADADDALTNLHELDTFFGPGWTDATRDKYEREYWRKHLREHPDRRAQLMRDGVLRPDPTLIEGKHSVNYETAALYLQCSDRMVRKLVRLSKQDAHRGLVSEGYGHSKRITVASLLRYRPL